MRKIRFCSKLPFSFPKLFLKPMELLQPILQTSEIFSAKSFSLLVISCGFLKGNAVSLQLSFPQENKKQERSLKQMERQNPGIQSVIILRPKDFSFYGSPPLCVLLFSQNKFQRYEMHFRQDNNHWSLKEEAFSAEMFEYSSGKEETLIQIIKKRLAQT